MPKYDETNTNYVYSLLLLYTLFFDVLFLNENLSHTIMDRRVCMVYESCMHLSVATYTNINHSIDTLRVTNTYDLRCMYA